MLCIVILFVCAHLLAEGRFLQTCTLRSDTERVTSSMEPKCNIQIFLRNHIFGRRPRSYLHIRFAQTVAATAQTAGTTRRHVALWKGQKRRMGGGDGVGLRA